MKTAVISGGAGGLGRALAADLNARGWFCALLDLPGALARVPPHPAQSLHPCDITDPAQIAATVAALRAARPSLDMGVYNAGITLIAPVERVGAEAHARVFAVNYWGAVHLAQALLPDLRQAKGRHVAIASVAGFAPLRHRSAYAASKHALMGFFGSLAADEAGHGVSVTLAAPSFVATNPGAPFNADGTGPPGAARDGIDTMDAGRAARVIVAGALARRAMVPVGRVAWLAWGLWRLSPGLYAWQMRRRMGDDRT